MKLDRNTFKLEDADTFKHLALIIGIIGLIGCCVGYFIRREQFFPSYLTAYVFWVTIGLGGLFFTLLHHLVDATWSVVLRRLTESVMATLPLMVIFFIPVIIGLHDLYHWSHADALAHDELLQKKAPYLNQTFFIIRAVIYFSVWYILARVLYKTSLKQDAKHDEQILVKLRRISGPGMLLFALTLTFAAFDWLMSLDPHWYSTMFGVYIFAGSLLSILAFVTLLVAFMRHFGILQAEVTIEHFHDLGKLLFAFTVFWSYIAFSQYFLIWYGDIPEETIWYRHRWENGWKYVSIAIVLGHFVIPFLVLLSRVPKRNVAIMTMMSVWILVVHGMDLYWVIIPNFQHHFHISVSEILIFAAAFTGVGGIFLFSFWKKFSSQPVIPVNDPKLRESINFVNV